MAAMEMSTVYRMRADGESEPLMYDGKPINVPMDRASILTWTDRGVEVRDADDGTSVPD